MRYFEPKECRNFLSGFESFRAYCDSADFVGVTNPADNVFYPGVSLDIPESVKSEVAQNLAEIEGRPIAIRALFLRISTAGLPAPHQAHTDSIMGHRSCMVYMNRAEDCRGGTSLVAHIETGMASDPLDAEQEAIWRADTNNPDAWRVHRMCEMEPNKAFIFPSFLMHRAEPVGGFGSDAKNGRLVLTAFYDAEDE